MLKTCRLEAGAFIKELVCPRARAPSVHLRSMGRGEDGPAPPPPLACWPEPQQPDVPTVTVFAANSDGEGEMVPQFSAAG